ncbi:MAG: O-antigen ligase family protein, partial [Nevskiales bacterium]
FFLVCALLYWLNHPGPITSEAFSIQLRYLFFLPFLFFFTYLLNKKTHEGLVFNIFLLTAIGFTALGFAEYIYHRWLEGEAFFRLSGYTNPQHYGNYAMLIFAASVAFHSLWHTRQVTGNRQLILAVLSTTTLALAMASQNRAALLSVPVIFGLSLVFIHTQQGFTGALRYLPKIVTIIVVSILINANAFFEMFEKTYGQAALIQDSESMAGSGFHRGEMWTAAVKVWQESPITGVGFGRYPDAAKKYLTDTKSTYLIENDGKPHHAHSGYFEYLAGGGVVGLAGLLLLLVAPFLYFLKGLVSRQTPPERRVYFLLGSLLFSVFITGNLTENFVFFKGWISLFVILSALVFAASRQAASSEDDTKQA